MSGNFNKLPTTQFGTKGEEVIAKWFGSKGYMILPTSQIETIKNGPRIFSATAQVVSPDLIVFDNKEMRWIEAKTKSHFAWYRIGQRWTTGIDLKYYNEYLNLAKSSPSPVWLMFLHISDTPSVEDLNMNCPKTCPAGLFGDDILSLDGKIDHKYDTSGQRTRAGNLYGGSGGMVYWCVSSLKKLATLEEVLPSPILRQEQDRQD
jgi:hypothetical protein